MKREIADCGLVLRSEALLRRVALRTCLPARQVADCRMRCIVGVLVVLPACSALAGSEGAQELTSLQAAAEGLKEGPLCSLVLRVEAGRTLDLAVGGASRDAGWGNIDPSVAPLGTICLPDANAPRKVERTGDWSTARLTATFGGGATVTLIASQLSPGIVVATSGDRLRLFAGRHERLVSKDARGRLQLVGFRGREAPTGAVTPALAAVPDGEGLKPVAVGPDVPSPPAEDAWMLLWWGDATHFARSDCPLAGRGRQSDACKADCPLLLVFDEAPKSIRPAPAGEGLDLAFGSPGRRMALLPLSGAALLPAAETQTWARAVPKDVAARCRELAAFARQYPAGVRRSFEYDTTRDLARFTETVEFLPVGKGGRKLAPLPPIAMVAMSGLLPVDTLGKRTALPLVTEFGPVVGAADADSVTWTVAGLKKYVRFRHEPADLRKAPADLVEELARQVQALLAAGPLRPWCYVDNVPINRTRGEYYWGEPGEALYLLDGIRQAVAPQQRTALADRMGKLLDTFPPERTAIIPPDAGAPRGGYDPGPCKAAEALMAERQGRVSVFALYGLERALAATGRKLDAASWAACRKLLADAFAERNWATLYLLGHPNRRLPWVKDATPPRASSQWLGDRPAAVVNANRTFAGAVAGVRLAQQTGDRDAEQAAWRLLAEAAVLRGAMGKLPAWRVRAALAKLPEDPAWQWRLESGSWGGYLQTPDWSRPEHDVRQVVELGQDGPRYDDFGGTGGDLWQQRVTAQLVAFRYMVPELAAFLRDHLRPETAELARRVELNLPTWYASFSEAILGWEHNMNHPSDAFELFCARAWVLDERPEQLARWIDIPWLARGDLFHMNKLAEVVRAFSRTTPETAKDQ